MANECLPRRERLRGQPRLDALFATGAVGKTRLVLVRALPNDLAYSRIAAIVGKAAGPAVVRNRIRRRLRALWRTRKEKLPPGYDLVLLARRGALEAPEARLAADLETAVRRAVGALTET